MDETGISKTDEYGFERPADFDYAAYKPILSEYLVVLTNRTRKWHSLLKTQPDLYRNKSRKLKRYVRKGIPLEFRSDVWAAMSGATVQQQKSPELYRQLLRTKFDATVVESIRIDLPRTFPDNIWFRGPEARGQMFNVLVAYAHHNKDIGYCQGLNYIAGLLWLVTRQEERTFWLLKTLLDNTIKSYHTKTMDGLRIDTVVLRELLAMRAPQVNQRLEVVGLPCAVMSTKWLVCVFAEVLPTETVLRVWDCLFLEGDKMLFRVSLTLLLANQRAIELAEDIVALAALLQDIVRAPEVIDCHRFMESVFRVPGKLRRVDIERLRQRATEQLARDASERSEQRRLLLAERNGGDG